jgi:hypothetical protein
MTEQEWLSGTFALGLLDHCDGYAWDNNGNPTSAQWRTIAARVACLERFGPDLPAVVRQWVWRATVYLDEEDRSADAELVRYWNEGYVYTAFREAYEGAGPDLRQCLAAAQDVYRGTDYYACEEYMLEVDDNNPTYTGPVYRAESAAHCDIIRDVFGNPFRPVVFSPAWRTDTAVSLARGMYESRDFGAMPILADALQDAGCDNDDMLGHCRDTKQIHVRGCWVVDLVLGKS